jgi:hypothetical protein
MTKLQRTACACLFGLVVCGVVLAMIVTGFMAGAEAGIEITMNTNMASENLEARYYYARGILFGIVAMTLWWRLVEPRLLRWIRNGD